MRRTEQAQGLRLMKFEEVYGRTRSRLLSQAEAAEVLGVPAARPRRIRTLQSPSRRSVPPTAHHPSCDRLCQSASSSPVS